MGNAITRRAVLILGASRGATRFQPVPMEINGKTREFPFRVLFLRYLRYVAFDICECSLTNPSVPLKVFFSLSLFFFYPKPVNVSSINGFSVYLLHGQAPKHSDTLLSRRVYSYRVFEVESGVVFDSTVLRHGQSSTMLIRLRSLLRKYRMFLTCSGNLVEIQRIPSIYLRSLN